MRLKGLELVDWAHLHHSHGTAERFPVCLNALASGASAAWLNDLGSDSAINYLWGHSIHQGSIYEITPHVVPFLNQILGIVSTEHQETLLEFLTHIAHASQYPSDSIYERETAMKQGVDFDAALAVAKQRYEDTQARLRDGLLIYTALLDSTPSKRHSAAIDLIGAMGHRSIESRQLIVTWMAENKIETILHSEITKLFTKKYNAFDYDENDDDDPSEIYYYPND